MTLSTRSTAAGHDRIRKLAAPFDMAQGYRDAKGAKKFNSWQLDLLEPVCLQFFF